MFNISERKEYKILLTIKARYKKYWVVGLSRHECSMFWLSERKMYEIINYLRDNGLLRWIKRVKCSSGLHSCHVYSITERLQAILNELKELKKEFTYITYTPDDVINYVSSFAKKKYWQWKFEREWILYIVADRWKWRWKIYDTVNNRIVSLITVQNAN